MAWLNESLKSENKIFHRAIVFIHGLNGNSSTWKGDSKRFVNVLRSDMVVSENFGLYIFEYPTKIVEFGFFKRMLSYIPGIKKKEFNVGIRRISMELKTNLYEILKDYKTIILVAHSMGGLISKKALVEMQNEEIKRIKLFMSVSVPHNGSALADIGTTLLGDNKQLCDLQIFSDFTSDLTNRFSNLTIGPKVVYQSGNQDLVVPEGSAIPAGVTFNDRIDTSDNHYSVLSIEDPASHTPYIRLIRELKDILILEQQQGTFDEVNGEVTFNIPENYSFKQVAELLAETANCTIQFKGFSEIELNILLKSQELSKVNTFKALEALQYIGQSIIPKYNIELKESHFKIIKT